MIFHEWSLIFFTVFAQTVFGSYLFISSKSLAGKFDQVQTKKIMTAMFFLWALMGIGFLFSTTHLGSPLRAFNSLNKVGSAWLSNEIFFGALFFAIGGMQWLLSMLDKGSDKINKGLNVAALVIGAMFMYSMINVYMMETVPTWDNSFTPLSFIATMLVSGLVFAHLLLTVSGNASKQTHQVMVIAGVAAALFSILVTVGKQSFIADIHTSVHSASELVDGVGSYLMAQVALIAFALVLWIAPVLSKKQISAIRLLVVFVLILMSELIGRGLFYSQHMTYGLT